jgi:hypothetical protein
MGADEFIVQGRLPLNKGGLLKVQDGPGVVVYLWEGELWLTQEGDRRDYLLRAGQWFRLDRDGTTVATALSRAVVSVTAPRPDYLVRRKPGHDKVHADFAPA